VRSCSLVRVARAGELSWAMNLRMPMTNGTIGLSPTANIEVRQASEERIGCSGQWQEEFKDRCQGCRMPRYGHTSMPMNRIGRSVIAAAMLAAICGCSGSSKQEPGRCSFPAEWRHAEADFPRDEGHWRMRASGASVLMNGHRISRGEALKLLRMTRNRNPKVLAIIELGEQSDCDEVRSLAREVDASYGCRGGSCFYTDSSSAPHDID
jgi:hypothetical protein